MGQYHRIVVIGARSRKVLASVFPHCLNESAKLVDFSRPNSTMARVAEHLFTYRHNGCKLVVCGEYDKGDLWAQAEAIEKETLKDLDGLNDTPQRPAYCVNLDKKEYVRLTGLKDGALYPVFLLCSNSNGRGGGDYHGDNEHLVGRWCGDRIKYAYRDPDKRYEELNVTFE